MENPSPNLLTWHYTQALPAFIKEHSAKFKDLASYLNLANLAKNLFAPYRKLTLTSQTGNAISKKLDELSFNAISVTIGAIIRLLLIAVGLFVLLIGFAYFTIEVILYAIFPPFSLPKKTSISKNTFFEADLKDSGSFYKKLKQTALFQKLAQFFDEQFLSAFEKVNPIHFSPNSNIDRILPSLFENLPELITYLEKQGLKTQYFKLLVDTLINFCQTPKKSRLSPIGNMLAFGYTNNLDKFGQELTIQKFHSNFVQKETLGQIAKVLTRTQANNALLVGEPGVGRHSTLENLAAAIAAGQYPLLSGKRLIMLDAVAIAQASRTLIDVKNNFEILIKEAKNAGNIILAIDQLDRITSSQENRMDLTEVLTTELRDNQLPVIGISTVDEFNQFVRPNGSLTKIFEKIDIPEPTFDETLSILISKALELYSTTQIATQLPSLVEIIDKSNKLKSDVKQPGKALVWFGDVAQEAREQKITTIDKALVDQIISFESKIPIGEISKTEGQKLKNLEEILHKAIIGQNEAIIEIAKAMRRSRAEIEMGNRPIGSFLFLGPTGVGKTETAKALARLYFGSEDKMIRLDMSEFQSEDSVGRLIGNLASKSPGQLADKIRQNPYCLLLVDEFEKANTAVLNLFLQILDEGFLTDAFGKKVSFDNIIIICTSNAGAEFIREQVEGAKGGTLGSEFTLSKSEGQGSSANSTLSKKLIDHILEKGLFSPELINRFDATIVYRPLTMDEVTQVTLLMLKNLSQKLKENKNITLEVTPALALKVAQAGYNPEFGARPIRRLIQDKIEDEIAKMIIDEKAKNGTIIKAETLMSVV